MSYYERNKYWITAGVVGLAFVVLKFKNRIFANIKQAINRDILSSQKIQVINTRSECRQAIDVLSKGCEHYKVLGFDCEWVTCNGRRHPVALLQLASQDGYCALFRLNKIRHVPSELKDILEDDKILKVGVSPYDDAHNLFKDYSICVNGTLDLRHLAVLANEHPEGLSGMSLRQLNVKLDKDWRLRCSDWEANELSDKQKNYAGTDALVAVEIFNKFARKVLKEKYNAHLRNYHFTSQAWKNIRRECDSFINAQFKQRISDRLHKKTVSSVPFDKLISDDQKRSMNMPNLKQPKRGFVTRSRPLYENCYMLNPNGQVLSTCDIKKAKWYVDKSLAVYVSEDPITIQLNFKPSGDVTGEVDKYYQIPRENRCVVCGHDDSYIRKNVIPREYRKLFPVVMKSHSSHDVLLLCNNCHQVSNYRDLSLRNKLSVECDAPLDSTQSVVVHRSLQRVASAAKALLESTQLHNIPEERRIELEGVLREYYGDGEDINTDMLKEACKLKYVKENPLYESHGKRVVDFFSAIPGGLLQLEEMWRQHFLDTMKPRYMPDLWSIQHNKERLEIRAVEGRLKKEDMLLSGFSKKEDMPLSDLSKKEDMLLSGLSKKEDMPLSDLSKKEDMLLSGLSKKEDMLLSGLSKKEDMILSGLSKEDMLLSGLSKKEDMLLSGLSKEDMLLSGLSKEDMLLSGLSKKEDMILSGLSKEDMLLSGLSKKEDMLLSGLSKEDMLLSGFSKQVDKQIADENM